MHLQLLFTSVLSLMATGVVKAHPTVSNPRQIIDPNTPYIDIRQLNRAAGAQMPLHTTALMASATPGAAH